MFCEFRTPVANSGVRFIGGFAGISETQRLEDSRGCLESIRSFHLEIRLTNHARKRWQERSGGKPVTILYHLVSQARPANNKIRKLFLHCAENIYAGPEHKPVLKTPRKGTSLLACPERKYAFLTAKEKGQLIVLTVLSVEQMAIWQSLGR